MSHSAVSELEQNQSRAVRQGINDFNSLARAEAAGETVKGSGAKLDLAYLVSVPRSAQEESGA